MARSDLLLHLVRAAVTGDRQAIERAVTSLAAEERAKKHGILADQLSAALTRSISNSHAMRAQAAPEAGRGKDLVAEVLPRRTMDSLSLPSDVRDACFQMIEEQLRVELLHSYALEPRSRVLLVGPPGNGKTALAEALAESMSLPLMVVRYDLLIGSYLGETAGRLRRLVDYIRTTPCVLFFDEFDAIGKERGDTNETGEIKRVVSSLLMHVDELPSYVVVVAATNHEELLDRAVWRRFQIRLELPAPNASQAGAFVKQFFGTRAGQLLSQKDLVQLLRFRPDAKSFAELEEACLSVLRRLALSQGSAKVSDLVADEIRIWKLRNRSGGEKDARSAVAANRARKRGQSKNGKSTVNSATRRTKP
jgi:SpoVK/Ycf46/Vps4 family AAA+-type ATPase